jgi:hypothetical protein
MSSDQAQSEIAVGLENANLAAALRRIRTQLLEGAVFVRVCVR